MYTVVLIFLGISAVCLLLYDQLKRRGKRRKAEAWVASQPLEALTSERRNAAEKARSLLEKQIDCDDFIDEFRKSQDPEIQKLVYIVESIETEEFLNDYRKSIEKRISVLEKGVAFGLRN